MFGLAIDLATVKAKLGLAVAALAVVLLLCGIFFYFGKREGRSEKDIDAALGGLSRIQTMEKNNAKNHALPAGDRCVLLARDSGLPVEICRD